MPSSRARGWQKGQGRHPGGAYFMVTLDEITYPLIYGWLPWTMCWKPCAGARVRYTWLTGRRCPPEMIELGDTVTEMQLVKRV